MPRRTLPLLTLCTFVAVGLALAGTPRAHAQDNLSVPVPKDENVGLRIHLDHEDTIQAYEPVYLCMWAEQFASGEVDLQISRDGEPFRKVRLNEKGWATAEIRAGADKAPVHRRGIVLLSETVGDKRSFIFDKPGTYAVNVRIGQGGGAKFKLKVTAPVAGEQPAWESLDDRVIDDIMSNNFGDEPSQGTVNACAQVIRTYPRTICAGYCQSYISIARFKILYGERKKVGGAAVYGAISDELVKVHKVFQDGFFGELTGFYAAYSLGLAKDFNTLLQTIGSTKTRMTLYGDALEAMQDEVMRHVGPKVISVDVAPPTTQPAAPAAKP